MSDPNLPHLEQAKQHLRDVQNIRSGGSGDPTMMLVWAIDEIIRHIEEGPAPSKPDCICGWRRSRWAIGGQTLAEHQCCCSIHQNASGAQALEQTADAMEGKK